MSQTVSVVLETENLAIVEPAYLRRTLLALADQEGLEDVLEVLVAHRGHLPPGLLEGLRAEFPWFRVITTPADLDYYGMKLSMVEQAAGDVVVFCDSDCVYAPGWLRGLTAPFAADPAVQVVAGATRVSGAGAYGLAMALLFIFDAPPRRRDRHPTDHYWFNNVAFRRALLLEQPWPTGLSLYRGACALHAYALVDRGVVIWLAPGAQAQHPPPDGVGHFVERFFHMGSDWVQLSRILHRRRQREGGPVRALLAVGERALAHSRQLPGRLRAALDEPGRRRRDVLPAVPICAAVVALVSLGALRGALASLPDEAALDAARSTVARRPAPAPAAAPAATAGTAAPARRG